MKNYKARFDAELDINTLFEIFLIIEAKTVISISHVVNYLSQTVAVYVSHFEHLKKANRTKIVQFLHFTSVFRLETV